MNRRHVAMGAVLWVVLVPMVWAAATLAK
jgi:hypothetical protein